MPVVSDEPGAYGYTAENRHMVQAFLDGRMPDETWRDGLAVVEVLMACYKAAEDGARRPLSDGPRRFHAGGRAGHVAAVAGKLRIPPDAIAGPRPHRVG